MVYGSIVGHLKIDVGILGSILPLFGVPSVNFKIFGELNTEPTPIQNICNQLQSFYKPALLPREQWSTSPRLK